MYTRRKPKRGRGWGTKSEVTIIPIVKKPKLEEKSENLKDSNTDDNSEQSENSKNIGPLTLWQLHNFSLNFNS